MADEIERNNVVSVERRPEIELWTASIGPDGRGITAIGMTPTYALINLALECERLGWIFDPSWRTKDP